MNATEIASHIDTIVTLSKQLAGHLTEKEVRFLSILPFTTANGEILEIGSFKGKSTIILAKSAIASGHGKVHACDPLLLVSSTDPTDAVKEELPELFRNNLKQNDVADIVEFFQIRSSELAKTWDKPLKVLWIDGDHTYEGALPDVELFQKHLVPGAVVCLHDVLHGFDGPIRVFMERILLSPRFGDCGLCGSIGWGQYIGKSSPTETQWKTKLALNTGLSRILPYIIKTNNGIKANKALYKFHRSLVPHGEINPVEWLDQRAGWQNQIS